MEDREELLEPLNYLYEGVRQIEELNGQRNALINQANADYANIQNEQKTIQASDNRKKAIRRGASTRESVGVAVTVIVSLILYGFIALFTAIVRSVQSAEEGSPVYFIEFIIIVGIAIYICYRIFNNSSTRKSKFIVMTDQSVVDAQNRIEVYQREIQDIKTTSIPEIDARLAEVWQQYGAVIDSFPPAYLFSDAIEKVIFYIKNQRAETIKEAINLYEKENYQNQILAEQRRQTTAAESSAKSNAISAAANVLTANNTTQIVQNTSQMLNYLRNIDYNSARMADNTEVAAQNSYIAAQNSAVAARNSAAAASSASSAEYYARKISNSLR